MIVLPQTASGRIALAIALSLLVHALMLFAPMVQLPPRELPLPPLTAKLEPLPSIAPPAPLKKTRAKAKPQPAAEVAAVPVLDPLPSPDSPPLEGPNEAAPPLPPDDPVLAETKPAHPLPKHAQLTFIAFQGTAFEIGEMRHQLEISDDHSYTIKVGMNTTGIASIFKSYESNQQSSGTLLAQGLHPNEFSEVKVTSKGKEVFSAHFGWAERTISFANGSQAALPDQAQDIVSFLYQLSQLPLNQGAIPMYISNGKKLERYELAVGEEELVETRLGKLRGLPLRRIHGPGEEGQEIWLGLEYRLLPIMIRQIDRSGKIVGEMRISEIRVADE